MGFHYAKEKRLFDLEWNRLQKEYEDAGMEPSAIEEMRNYDWTVFLSRRIYENHTQPLPDTYLGDETDGQRSRLLDKFSSLSMTFDEGDFPGRYAWVSAIEDAVLARRLSKISSEDLELLTLYAIEGHTQKEIALLLRRNQSVISRKINRIKNFLKNF